MVGALLLAGAVAVTVQDSAWAPLARLIDSAIAQRAFPGAVVAIGRRDTVLYLEAFGRLDYSGGARVTTRTVYDVASLTKVVGLTTAIMMLVEEGRVDLDAPVRRYVRRFGREHDSTITVRRLLTHSSGLPAWRPLWQRARSRREVFDLAGAEPLEYSPGTRMVYSDLGAIVLTDMVETLTGQRLDRFLESRLFRPLDMRQTRFRPPRSWRPRIAPTEVDTVYRRRLVWGEVHDENAFAMEGVSGHAGLFSTAPDLARFAQLMLREGAPLLGAETVRLFARRQDPTLSHRALGWETPNGQNSAGSRLSPRAFGHTGFTGTSLWIDPERDLFVILLTNRVHPTRDNTRIFEVRRRLADLAVGVVR